MSASETAIPDRLQDALSAMLEAQFQLGKTSQLIGARKVTRTHCLPMNDALLKVVDEIRQAMDAAAAAAREECMGKLDSHGRYWVENRGRILDALTAAGFQLMSNKDRFWLAPLLRDTAQKP